jgi:Protein of unknown function (DUF3532).
MEHRTISEQELDAQIKRGTAAGRKAAESEPRAKSARYDAVSRQIVVELTNGCTFIFPADLAQGLKGATDEQLAEVAILGRGYGLHWETLDADLSIPALVMGIFGSHAWMRELARRGGASTSEAKTAAARANGAKGGRPKKAA